MRQSSRGEYLVLSERQPEDVPPDGIQNERSDGLLIALCCTKKGTEHLVFRSPERRVLLWLWLYIILYSNLLKLYYIALVVTCL